MPREAVQRAFPIARRDFMRLGLASAIASPGAAAARERMRTLVFLVTLPLSDSLVTTQAGEQQSRIPAHKSELAKRGWVEGRNIRYEVRSTYGGAAAREQAIRETMALAPDLIMTSSTIDTAAVQAATRTIPILFATAADPVGSGLPRASHGPAGTSRASPTATPGWGASGWSS
jgi:putative ABC transport system substrate-binding protein